MEEKKPGDSKIIKYGRKLNQQHPSLRPIIKLAKKIFFSKPRFSGWGMNTEHELPWIDEYDGEVFTKASDDIKKQFQFNKRIVDIDSKNIDELLWRHWVVITAVRYAIKFSKTDQLNFVECGVGEGFSAFFALRDIVEKQKVAKFFMHLYDAWDSMKKEQLVKSEMDNVHTYDELDLNTTKQNLEEFKDYVIYHKGYIPESFHNKPDSPEIISYLHIDLNAVTPTIFSLEFFYPRLTKGGIILFDDYGWAGYEDTKKAVDEFFKDKPGLLIKFPTGQAIYLHR